MVSSLSVEWATPSTLLRALDAEFHFDLDICPMEHRIVIDSMLNFDGDALSSSSPRPKTVWMNPPYGRGVIDKWLNRAYRESQNGSTVVCLLPARTDTHWWHSYCMQAEIRFLRGRLNFINPDGKKGRAPFPSAIVILRPPK